MVKIEKYEKKNFEQLKKEYEDKGELQNTKITITNTEIKLEKVLIRAGIQVIPQYTIDNRSFDFKVKHYPILIEVDGSIHNMEQKRLNDYKKDRYVQRRGYRVYRFANSEIHNEKYFYKIIGEIKSMIKYCGKQPVEVHLYPLSIGEQIKMWWANKRGKKWENSVRVEVLK